jgi:hypothetical protein
VTTTAPGGNTKPLPDTVTAALDKAREQTPSERSAEVDHASATHLDSELRGLARTVARNVARFKELIDLAREQRVHEVLGFPSWTTYVADVISKEMGRLDADTRRDLVALLAGEGMSNRAIADAVGVNEITVRRDKDQVRHNVAPERVSVVVREDTTPEPARQIVIVRDPASRSDFPPPPPRPLPPEEQAAIHQRIQSDREQIEAFNRARKNTSVADAIATITGRDGKTYPSHKSQPPPEQKPRRNSIVDEMGTAVFHLYEDVRRVRQLVADNRFPDNRIELSRRNGGDLGLIVAQLNDVISVLENPQKPTGGDADAV